MSGKIPGNFGSFQVKKIEQKNGVLLGDVSGGARRGKKKCVDFLKTFFRKPFFDQIPTFATVA
jgi:hypothetical protein